MKRHGRGVEYTAEMLSTRAEPEPNTGCWLWTGSLNTNGYGTVQHKGRMSLVHRLMCEFTTRRTQQGELVCHRCDVRWCVNPDHLFLGSFKDNMRDMAAKGRWRNQFNKPKEGARPAAVRQEEET